MRGRLNNYGCSFCCNSIMHAYSCYWWSWYHRSRHHAFLSCLSLLHPVSSFANCRAAIGISAAGLLQLLRLLLSLLLLQVLPAFYLLPSWWHQICCWFRCCFL